ncbi:MAG: hypothetical protein V3V14_03720 [Saprospiraceae bacterium]
MKKYLLFCYFSIFITSIYGQNSIYPKIPYADLSDISLNENNILCTGYCNSLKLSRDKGQSWENIESDNFLFSKIVPSSIGQKAYLIGYSKLSEINFDTKEIKQTITNVNGKPVESKKNIKYATNKK